MKTTTAQSAIASQDDLKKISTSDLLLDATYAFSNPFSINGPFGTLHLVLSDGSPSIASGEITINTLFGLGTVTHLVFSTPAQFDPSTGYTTITGTASGTMTVRPDPPKHITTHFSISLQPGMEEGLLTVTGFFSDFTLRMTSRK